MDIRHRGTFRTDYEADWARLDDFQALTAEADKLLHRLIRASREIPYHNADGQEVILVSFLERHVLTVLADIARSCRTMVTALPMYKVQQCRLPMSRNYDRTSIGG